MDVQNAEGVSIGREAVMEKNRECGRGRERQVRRDVYPTGVGNIGKNVPGL